MAWFLLKVASILLKADCPSQATCRGGNCVSISRLPLHRSPCRYFNSSRDLRFYFKRIDDKTKNFFNYPIRYDSQTQFFLESELVGHSRIVHNSSTPKLIGVQLFNIARVNSHVIWKVKTQELAHLLHLELAVCSKSKSMAKSRLH